MVWCQIRAAGRTFQVLTITNLISHVNLFSDLISNKLQGNRNIGRTCIIKSE